MFGDLTYHFTEKLDVQVGARYSENEQDNASASTVAPTAQIFFGPSASVATPSEDDKTTWLVTPRYRFSDDFMAYLRVATGYRPGGANNNVPGVPVSFDPDTVLNYELGFKGYLFDRLLSFDASVFQIDWEDILLQATDAGNLAFITNGGEAGSRGLELALQLNPWQGMTIALSGTYRCRAVREHSDAEHQPSNRSSQSRSQRTRRRHVAVRCRICRQSVGGSKLGHWLGLHRNCGRESQSRR